MERPARDAFGQGRYRLEELGWLQFQHLAEALLELDAGLPQSTWPERRDEASRTTIAPEGVRVPGSGEPLAGPTVVLIAPARGPSLDLPSIERLLRGTWASSEPRSLLVLTSLPISVPQAEIDGVAAGPLRVTVLGRREIGAIVDARPELRFRVPTVLGLCDLEGLVGTEARACSTADVEAAVALARVFVPTRAYARTLEVLARSRFAVLTGPPEMGKTATARMIGLAALADGFEVHECIRPDELWTAFDRSRAQVFIADDAFGSTEYRPEAAERWALELDRVLRAMDERHWLLWTSRPAPLKAGLRRIHREHGVERFPQPAEVHVAADDLDVEEKALILFRHALAAQLSGDRIAMVRANGMSIVEHPHFTPERIRRFVSDRLPRLGDDPRGVGDAIADEIQRPTEAMAASFRALEPEHRTLLVAMLDSPPGSVPERELAAALRRHASAGMPRPPGELVDRLTDHFLRLVPPTSVTWVHPSWRDLVITELMRDAPERLDFLDRCELDGALLALSVAGGRAGERRFPLLITDADWDRFGQRLARLAPTLDDSGVFRVLTALEAAADEAYGLVHIEVQTLARQTLRLVSEEWNRARRPVSVGLIETWLRLAARVPDPPRAPALAVTWIELLPTESIDLLQTGEVARLDDWTTLAAALSWHYPTALREFGFPRRSHDAIVRVAREAERVAGDDRLADDRESLTRSLRRLVRLAPHQTDEINEALATLATLDRPRRIEARSEPRETDVAEREIVPSIVERILSDLEPTPEAGHMPIE